MNITNKRNGIFVTFDGPNGVGKSSLVSKVADLLIALGVDTLRTAEPTNSSLGQFIRANEENYRGRILGYLVAADRYLHLESEILPALENRKVVLSDRYIESSLVLQRLDGLDFEFIWELNRSAYIPELSVVLTASVKVLEQRLSKRASLTRLERQNSSYDELNYYSEAAKYLSNRGFNIMSIDNGNMSIENNAEIVVNKILSLVHIKNNS
jgi:dTMP kinase